MLLLWLEEIYNNNNDDDDDDGGGGGGGGDDDGDDDDDDDDGGGDDDAMGNSPGGLHLSNILCHDDTVTHLKTTKNRQTTKESNTSSNRDENLARSWLFEVIPGNRNCFGNWTPTGKLEMMRI